MKIIHIVWQMSIGGIETMLMDIASVQAETEEVHIVAINDNQNPDMMARLDPRIKFYCCGRKLKSRSPLPFVKLNAYLLHHRPDIIHTHFLDIYKYIYYRGIKVKTIHNTRNNPREFDYYDCCYAISRSVRDEWAAIGRELIPVVNGINCNAIRQRVQIREKKPFTADEHVHIVQVSRLFIKQKGQDIAIKALELLQEKMGGEGPRITLHFIGEGPDEEFLRKMAEEAGLKDQVVFEGLKSREWVYDNLYRFDLFVQPSRFEGFGLTVAEACAAKIPVLVSDNDGPNEILDGGRLGMTFKSGDAEALARKLHEFISEGYSPGTIEEAYRHTLANYDVRHTALTYIEEYRKVINKRKRNAR